MLALRAINRASVVTTERLQQHRLYDSPPLITAGKYRPLEQPEIYAAVKESTPPYDYSVDPLEDGSANQALKVARHCYGPNVHLLTEDMALQFAGRLVYFIDAPYEFLMYPSDTRERNGLIYDSLALGLFSQGSLYDPYLGEHRDIVTCYMRVVYLLGSGGIPRSIDPYCVPERVLPIDRSGFVMEECCEYPIYVLAEKLD